MKRIYLDHNATTPVRKETLEAMLPFFVESYGNPSSAHSFGSGVREAVETSRQLIADAIQAQPSEILFTSGGTESDNLALIGVANTPLAQKKRKLVVSAIEHPAIMSAANYLGKRGFETVHLPVTEHGVVDLEAAQRLIDTETLLVSVMLANNDIGTIQPIRELARIAHAKGAIMHTDAVQGLGKIPVHVKELEVDLASFASHKIYGPKGIGALYVKKGIRVQPLLFGGHQEKKLRPGTENVPGIIGFGKACELASVDLETGEGSRIKVLRDMLQQSIEQQIPHILINGGGAERVPNTLNVSFMYVEGEGLMLSLDALGIAVSTGSACSSGSLEPSHVLLAMGVPVAFAHGSIRFSLGRSTSEADIHATAQAVVFVVAQLRSMSPLYEDFLATTQKGR